MIAWISEWLQNIILIVLLATFADLLLPSSTMQKYTKMVFGLLVIVTIISPVLNVFTDEFGIERILRNIETDLNSRNSVNAISTEMKAEAKNVDYEEGLINQVENKMTVQLQQLVENKYPLLVKKVNLDAKLENQSWLIKTLEIYLVQKSDADDGNSTEKLDAKIDEVKDIQIEISQVKIDEGNKVQTDSQGNSNSPVSNKLVVEIANLVESEWGLSKDQVIVYIN